MKREFLKELGLEKEVIDKILDEAGSDLEKAKGDYDTLKKEKEHLDEELKKRDTQITDLQKNVKSVEDLTTEINKLKEENETTKAAHESEMKTLKINTAVEKALTGAKAKNIAAVKALLKDIDKAVLNDDGTVKGLDAQIKTLKEAEDSKFLFDEPQKTVITGASPAASGNGTITGKTDTTKMTYSEMVQYLKENPNAQI